MVPPVPPVTLTYALAPAPPTETLRSSKLPEPVSTTVLPVAVMVRSPCPGGNRTVKWPTTDALATTTSRSTLTASSASSVNDAGRPCAPPPGSWVEAGRRMTTVPVPVAHCLS